MPGTTPKLALPYPTASDPDNVPGDVQALASAVEVVLGRRGLLSARPAAGNEGRFYDTIDTAQTFRDNGTSWDEVLFRASADAAYVSRSGGSLVVASSSSTTGMGIKGAASQTANLQEWQDSTGVVLALVNGTGSASFQDVLGVNTVNAGAAVNDGTVHLFSAARTATKRPLIVRGAASQSANLVEVQDSTGAVMTGFDNQGRLIVPAAISVTTATSGGASALPTTPAGYFKIQNNAGTQWKVPYYNT